MTSLSKVLLPAQFTKPVFRSDRSVRLEFETRELLGAEVAILTDMRQSEGWLLFSPNDDITIEDVPTEKADASLGTKTPSQRQRAIIFRLWEQANKPGDFESYYRSKMEYINDLLKEKLE